MAEQPNKVFIGGVPVKTKNEELREFFTQFGEVLEADVVTDRTGRGRGFGFVVFADEEVAKKVIEDSGKRKIIFKGRDLDLKTAKPKEAISPEDIKTDNKKRIYIGDLPDSTEGIHFSFSHSSSFFILNFSIIVCLCVCVFVCLFILNIFVFPVVNDTFVVCFHEYHS